MAADPIVFPPYRLDLEDERLLRGTQHIALKPKTFAILRYMVENPGRLITKQELLETVWGQVRVTEDGLRTYIRQLRHALGDDPKRPRFIETVHSRGYRWIAPSSYQQNRREEQLPSQLSSLSVLHAQHAHIAHIVGRESELGQLQAFLDKACQGERQVVFVTGEPGIGKTTVIEAFLKQTLSGQSLQITQGQCFEHYGPGEAYLPVLEALGRLCREPVGPRVIDCLRHNAPTWLAQLPWLLSPTEQSQLGRQVMGATQTRMLREFAEVIEALTADTPLVLVLEDLHWSDSSTLDLITHLAQRREHARFLLIGSTRTRDGQKQNHPLAVMKQALQSRGRSSELVVPLLSQAAIATYVAQRLPDTSQHERSFQEFVQVVHDRTEGNPLFMVNIVDDCIGQDWLHRCDGQPSASGPLKEIERGVPESLGLILEQRIARLGPLEQRVLETASVAGVEFSAEVVAAGLQQEPEACEACLSHLARQERFVQVQGTSEWPD